MNRRRFNRTCAIALAFNLELAVAQSTARPWRIGFLAFGARPSDGLVPAAIRDELRTLGFEEGKDIAYEARWSQARADNLPRLAVELLNLKVDVLIAFGGPAAEEAKRTFATGPVVVLGAGDVVETGLVRSLAHPGGNITGVNDPAKDLSGKRLQILKELVPGAVRVAVLWNAGNLAMTLRYREIEKAGSMLGIEVEPLGVREPDDFDTALAAMNRRRPDALMMVTDTLTTLNRGRVLDYVRANHIPAIYEFSGVVHDGGLISYGSELAESLALAADQVGRILRGTKPGDLPVDQPSRYRLVINLSTAATLGLSVPPSLLQRADEVIR